MGGNAMYWFRRRYGPEQLRQLSKAALATADALSWCSPDDGLVWASVTTLMQKSGLSRSSVFRGLNELEGFPNRPEHLRTRRFILRETRGHALPDPAREKHKKNFQSCNHYQLLWMNPVNQSIAPEDRPKVQPMFGADAPPVVQSAAAVAAIAPPPPIAIPRGPNQRPTREDKDAARRLMFQHQGCPHEPKCDWTEDRDKIFCVASVRQHFADLRIAAEAEARAESEERQRAQR
jgi:hypothetical protein